MRKIAVLFTLVVVVSGSLAACSSGTKAYCSDLKSLAAEKKQGLDQQTISAVKKLQGEAPKELKDDWRTLADLYQKIEDAGSDQAKVARIVGDAKDFPAAARAISQHAKDECKVTLKTNL